jgi:holo-[acyl-carrier protein] synthase
MIKIGTDICSVTRIAQAYEKYGKRFLERILTVDEMSYVVSHPHHLAGRLAGRFAVKEAASKVLGTGWNGVGWKEIEVVKHASGAPSLKLHGRAEMLAGKMGLTSWEVTISHEREFATAFVLAHSS